MSSRLVRGPGILIVGAAVFLSGCMTSVRTALPQATKDAKPTASITIGLAQTEIGTDIVESNAGAASSSSGGIAASIIGGVIDASIDKARARDAEAAVAPLRKAMAGYDVRPTLQEAFRQVFANNAGPLAFQSVDIAPAIDAATGKRIVNSATTDAVLIVRLDHRFTPSFSHIRIDATATLYARKASLAAETTGKLTVLYSNQFLLLIDRPRAQGYSSYVAYWAQDNAAQLKETLATSFQEIAEMIAFDLPAGVEANRPKKDTLETSVKGAEIPGKAGSDIEIKGTVVRTQPTGRKWIRLANGSLSSVMK